MDVSLRTASGPLPHYTQTCISSLDPRRVSHHQDGPTVHSSKAPEAWSLPALSTRDLFCSCVFNHQAHTLPLKTHPGLPAWPLSLRCPGPSAITTGSFSNSFFFSSLINSFFFFSLWQSHGLGCYLTLSPLDCPQGIQAWSYSKNQCCSPHLPAQPLLTCGR